MKGIPGMGLWGWNGGVALQAERQASKLLIYSFRISNRLSFVMEVGLIL